MPADLCEQIAQVRRKLQRVSKDRIVFLDETFKREGDVSSYSLFLPGQPPYIETSATSTNSRVGRSSGMVMKTSRCQGLTPSMRAAS